MSLTCSDQLLAHSDPGHSLVRTLQANWTPRAVGVRCLSPHIGASSRAHFFWSLGPRGKLWGSKGLGPGPGGPIRNMEGDPLFGRVFGTLTIVMPLFALY